MPAATATAAAIPTHTHVDCFPDLYGSVCVADPLGVSVTLMASGELTIGYVIVVTFEPV